MEAAQNFRRTIDIPSFYETNLRRMGIRSPLRARATSSIAYSVEGHFLSRW
jgi:hypothetical protein